MGESCRPSRVTFTPTGRLPRIQRNVGPFPLDAPRSLELHPTFENRWCGRTLSRRRSGRCSPQRPSVSPDHPVPQRLARRPKRQPRQGVVDYQPPILRACPRGPAFAAGGSGPPMQHRAPRRTARPGRIVDKMTKCHNIFGRRKRLQKPRRGDPARTHCRRRPHARQWPCGQTNFVQQAVPRVQAASRESSSSLACRECA